MAKLDIEMRGIEKAIKGIKGYEMRKLKAIKRSVAETAIRIESQAIALTPVDTGNLKNSIGTNYYGDGLTAEIGTPVDYAPFVEYGTRFMSAQPFLMPSYVRHRKTFIEEINKIVKEG